jgi:hypothetical protein
VASLSDRRSGLMCDFRWATSARARSSRASIAPSKCATKLPRRRTRAERTCARSRRFSQRARLSSQQSALFKPADVSVTKTSYETLADGITKLTEQMQRNHEDVVALRSYVDGVMRGPVPVPTATAYYDAGVAISDAGRPATFLTSVPTTSVSVAIPSPAPFPATAYVDPKPPPLHPNPPAWKPPAFSDVQQRAKE